MDKNEILGSRLITEQDMICIDCVWRAELCDNMPPSKCRLYPTGKPLHIISRVPMADCSEKVTEDEFNALS